MEAQHVLRQFVALRVRGQVIREGNAPSDIGHVAQAFIHLVPLGRRHRVDDGRGDRVPDALLHLDRFGKTVIDLLDVSAQVREHLRRLSRRRFDFRIELFDVAEPR